MSEFQSLDRAIRVLFAFSRERSRLSAEQIASVADLPLGSVYRYINALVAHGLLERDQQKREYRLGYRLLYFHHVVNNSDTLESASETPMRELAEQTDETIQLTLIRGDRGIAIKSIESSANVRVAPPLGKFMPLYAGANYKAILAFRPAAEQDRVFAGELQRLAPGTILDVDELKEDLQKIRENGYAFSSEEMHQGAWGVAAPIKAGSGEAIASLGVSGPLFRMTDDHLSTCIRLVRDYAQRISDRLRYVDWSDPSI